MKYRGFTVNSYVQRDRSNQITVVPGLVSSVVEISTNRGA